MSGTALAITLTLVVLTVCTMATIIVALVLRHCGRGMGLPGALALLVPGRVSENTTTWEPFIVDPGPHDHTGDYATPGEVTRALTDHVNDHHRPHDHDQYVTRTALNLRLAALRVSQIPQNLRGALTIIVAASLVGAFVGLMLDLTALRQRFHHQTLDSVTGKVIGTTVKLTPHYHVVTDWLQALGVITMCGIAGALIGAILVVVSWHNRDRQVEEVHIDDEQH